MGQIPRKKHTPTFNNQRRTRQTIQLGHQHKDHNRRTDNHHHIHDITKQNTVKPNLSIRIFTRNSNVLNTLLLHHRWITRTFWHGGYNHNTQTHNKLTTIIAPTTSQNRIAPNIISVYIFYLFHQLFTNIRLFTNCG